MSNCCRFRRNTSGSVAIIFALLATVMLGFVAMAVDYARALNASGKISIALDAAGLAAAKRMDGGATDAEVQAIAQLTFDANMKKLAVGGVTMSLLNTAIDRVNSSVTTTVSSTMTTHFASVIGKPSMQVGRSSQVAYKIRDIELAMVLDNTGSMAGSKISDLKAAAKDVIDTLLTDAPTESAARIALVPFAASVNAGTMAPSVSGGASVDDCVVERTGPNATTDVAASGINTVNAITGSSGNYSCPNGYVMPLSGKSKISALNFAVDQFMPSGATAGHIGTAWGWYMVSPDWAGIVGSSSAATSYGNGSVVKAVVVMTDGSFNTSYTGASDQTTDSYNQFRALCAGMKASKVMVFTIGFGMVAGSGPDTELSNCASSAANYFPVSSGGAMKAAFKAIANQLMSLRVSR